MRPTLIKHLKRNFEEYVEELCAFVKKPSVSATGEGIRSCASFLAQRMAEYGIHTETRELPGGNPIILGKVSGLRKDRTLLVYDHYDVQPADPLDAWEFDPFSGRVEQDRVLGRGAADSKGNLMAYLSAIRLLSETGGLPMSVTLLFEGEEEIGSPHLADFIDSHSSELASDAVVCCDGEMDPSGRPMISLGMKGLIYVELRCRKLKRDVHSSKASLLPSASWRIVKALNELTDADGRISIPGWREGIVEPSTHDLNLLREIPFDEDRIKAEFGVSDFLHGKSGFQALRDFLYEPTCNIAGLIAGYQGEGSKTVLPAEARAKLDLRLVYDQDADRCLSLLREHLKSRGFGDVEVSVFGKINPSHTPSDAPIARAAAEAATAVYREKPVIYPKHHASGPDCLFTKNLGLHSVWTGCAPGNGRAHAPNEFIGLEDFRLGILYACELISRFAQN